MHYRVINQVAVATFLMSSTVSQLVLAKSLLRDGTHASTIATGGMQLSTNDVSGSVNSQPSNLGQQGQNTLQFSMTTAVLDATYKNATTVTSGTDADEGPGFIPDFAYSMPITDKLGLGLSFGVLSAIEADYKFPDPAGATPSLGNTGHRSSYIVTRAGFGVGFQVTPRWSVGTSVGLLYNRNRLKAPYIFQSEPVLAGVLGGAKVSVDLEADGLGFNAVLDTRFQLTDEIDVYASYTTASSFTATGDLTGDSGPIGIGTFAYDAKVKTRLPQKVIAGLNWQLNDPLLVGLQFEWIDWSRAFKSLPVLLTNGTNTALNTIVGGTALNDIAPLNWNDQYVVRTGMQYEWSDRLQLRAGYSYADNLVPAQTLTPLTSAIMEHSLTLGIGYQFNHFNLDLAYQWDVPNKEKVGTSGLLAGEYSNSEVDVSVHWFTVSVSLSDLFNWFQAVPEYLGESSALSKMITGFPLSRE